MHFNILCFVEITIINIYPVNKIALVFPGMDGAAEPNLATSEHLGLGYIAAILRQNKYEVLIINAEIERLNPKQVLKRILDFNPFLVGLSPVSLSILNTLNLINQIKKANIRIKTLLGGHLATMCGTDILRNEPSIDYILKGDVEYSITDLLEAICKTTKDIGQVPGLIFRNNENEIIENSQSTESVDLNKIPYCERDDLLFLSEQKEFDFSARISASRGCIYDCSFCTDRAVYGKTVRFRKEADVVGEMNYLDQHFSIKHFWFNDDLFVNGTPSNTKWVDNFTGMLLRNRSTYSYRILCRADSFNNNNMFLLDKLVETGLSHIYFGIESGSQNSLDIYNKKITVEDNKKAVDLIKSKNIELTLGYIMFNPYSSFQDIIESTLFLFNINELFRIFPLTNPLSVYPNTPIAKRLLKDGLLISDSYKEPLSCYIYKNDRIGFLSKKMSEYYNKTYQTEIYINKRIKGLKKSNSNSELNLQNNLNALNKEKFLFICSYLQNSSTVDEDYLLSFFNEWTEDKKRILSDYSVSSISGNAG